MERVHLGSRLSSAALALAALVAPSIAAAQVDPTRAFYAVAFTHGSPHNGVITAQSSTSPFAVVATATRGTLNGAITYDPVRGVLYGGSCCTANAPLQAYDPVTLGRVAARDIPVTFSGSLAVEVDAPRRVLFLYDAVSRALNAISLAEGSAYGTVVSTLTLSPLPAEPVATSAGDQIAVDARGQQVFVTGGDGGPVLAIDVSRITAAGGAFGSVTDTGHRNRTTGNSGGGVAVDEAGRRVFFFPSTGAVRIVGADAPFALLSEVPIPSMASNDCGLHFDGRTSNLYVGRGASASPVVVSFPSQTVTPFATGPGDVPALSFASAGTACVDRDGDRFFPAACAPAGARIDCDDADRARNPEAAEACDGADNDCDALVDEGFCRIDGTCFTDGQANPAGPCQVCAAPATASASTAWQPAPMGSVCRVSAGECDVAETCDGTGTTCAADGFLPATTVCRAAAGGGCDVAERCTGSAATCPMDARRPAGEVCRATATHASCDPAEACDGTSAACPTDVVTRAPAMETCNGVDDDCDGLVDEIQCDAGTPDVGVADVGTPDVGTPDVGVADVGVADVGVADMGVADVGIADAGSVDAGAADVGTVADVGVAVDAGSGEIDSGTGEITAPQNDGCGCAVPGRAATPGGRWLAMLGAALALAARRRRRSS